MSRFLEEWQKHVRKDPANTFCGEWPVGWVFQSAEHAMRTVAGRERLLPCPTCWERIGAGDLATVPKEGPLLVEHVLEIRKDELQRCVGVVRAAAYEDGKLDMLAEELVELLGRPE